MTDVLFDTQTPVVAGAPVPAATGQPTRKIVGLDLSLKRTGIAAATGAESLAPPEQLLGFARMRWIRARVRDWTDGADLVVVEAPAYSSNKAHAKATAGLWHVVMISVDARGTRWVDVMANTNKKYATGNGRAEKAEMLIAALKRLPIDVANDDEADAAWLCAFGHDLLGQPLVELPARNREALVAVRARFDVTGAMG